MGFPVEQLKKALAATFPGRLGLLDAPQEKKINMGSGSAMEPGWINADRCYPWEQHCRTEDEIYRVKMNVEKALDYFERRSASIVFTHHVLEHIHKDRARDVFADWCELVEPGGVIYVCVPDIGWYLDLARGGKHWALQSKWKRGSFDADSMGWAECNSMIYQGGEHLSSWYPSELLRLFREHGLQPKVWARHELEESKHWLPCCETIVVARRPHGHDGLGPRRNPKVAISNYGVGTLSVLQGHKAMRDGVRKHNLMAAGGDLIYYGKPSGRHEYGKQAPEKFADAVKEHGAPDILIGQACVAGPLFKRAKKLTPDTIRILQRNSTHAREYQALLNAEYERVGVDSRVDDSLVEHECSEYDLADRIFCVSRWVQRSFEKHGLGDKVRYVSPQTIDLQYWKPIQRPPDGIRFRVLVAGQIRVAKGAHVALQAWKLLKPGPQDELCFSGNVTPEKGTQEREYLEELIADTPRVRVLDWCNIRDMPIRYAMSDIYSLPSIQEGSSNTCMESLAMCRPVVLTENCGCDLLEDHEHEIGMMVPQSDPEALAGAWEQYRSDRSLLRDHGRRAREVIDALGGMDRFSRDYAAAIRGVWEER